MSAEDSGLLGNLPRSRPGTRSDKRETTRAQRNPGAAATRKVASKRSTTAGARAAAFKARTAPAPAAPKRATAAPERDPAERSDDPVGNALKGAAKAAGAGLRVAEGVTRGVLRRLPRP